jgi:hypothetical protein
MRIKAGCDVECAGNVLAILKELSHLDLSATVKNWTPECI